jgi:hypothetical protein
VSSNVDPVSSDRWRRSLERSRGRRAAAVRAARRRLRSRGSILSLVALLAVGAIGADLASGQSSQIREAVGEAPTTYLTKGARGAEVSAVQSSLGVPADGVFGRQTLAAVRDFQERNGLLVDGVVGPQTRAALGLGGAPAAPKPEQPAPAPKPQKPPAAEQQPEPEQSGGGGQATGGSAPSGVLQDIAQCESGGDPTAVSSDGQYRGKYQFTRETWQGLGGSGDPASASEAEQDRRAQQLLDQSGTAPWAGCL